MTTYSPVGLYRLLLSIALIALPLSGAAPTAQAVASVQDRTPKGMNAVPDSSFRAASDAKQEFEIRLVATYSGNTSMRSVSPIFTQPIVDVAAPAFYEPFGAGVAQQEDSLIGVHLPEPGPVSAIIATLALAAFFCFRRVR